MTSPSDHPSQQVLRRTGASLPVVQGGMTFGSDGRLYWTWDGAFAIYDPSDTSWTAPATGTN